MIGPKLGAQETSAPVSNQPTRSYTNVRVSRCVLGKKRWERCLQKCCQFVNNSSSRRSAPSTGRRESVQNGELPLHVEEPEPLLGPGDDMMESLVGSTSSQSKMASPFAASHVPQAEWKDYFSTTHAASGKNETATLLHFQYNLAPWIEAGDLGSSFGTEVMLLAQRRRPILSAISLAASSQLDAPGSAYDASIALQREIEHALTLEDPRVRRIGHALLALREVFTLSPSQWRRLSFFQTDESTRNANSFSGFGEPLETLLRFHSRIGAYCRPFKLGGIWAN